MTARLHHFIYITFFLFLGLSHGQNILLNPAQGYSGSQLKYKLMFSKTDSVVFSWSKNITSSGYKIKVGTTRGNYSTSSFSVTKNRFSVLPSAAGSGLTVGRYFAVITNSTQNTLSGIQSDYSASPSTIYYSNEIEFVIEAKSAPLVIAPRGSIEESTPLFEWNPVSGVPAYWLIVSSTPFSVVTLESGEVSVQGANVLWNYITKNTSVRYGDPNTSSAFSDDAPPLLPGNEYNYTILNLYDEDDITYVSSVFGGAVSFTYNSPATINPPVLVAPAENSSFNAVKSIQFKWDPVSKANNYTLYLFERVSSFAGNEQEIDIPVTNFTTTNTSVTIDAINTLKKGKYVWYVIPNDNNGAGNKSVTRTFDYILDMGAFSAQAFSTLDGKNLIGFEIKANAVSGGSTPANSFYATNATTYKDSLVTGTYEITGKKAGYTDSTFLYQISKNTTANIKLYLRPLPARISGKVVNQSGNAVTNALVKVENILTGSIKNLYSDAGGNFTASVQKGSYYIIASKPGYKPSAKVSVTADKEQVILSSYLKLTLDNVSFFGKVLNDELKPVSLALVKATKDGISQEVKSDDNGNFSLQLTSGSWTIEASKQGFISSGLKAFSFSPGESITNEVFKVIPRANQVSGTVKRIYINANNTTSTIAIEDVKITATPISGTPVTALSNTKGSYNLSLKSGSYQVRAEKKGYSADKVISLDLSVAQTISNIDFLMTPNPSSITGRVTSSSGQSISGAAVKTDFGEQTTTLSDGTYILSVSQGTKILGVTKDGYISPEPSTINISAGQNITGRDFTMLPNAAKITGSVTNLQLPVNGAEIKAVSGSKTRTTLSDDLGKFNLNVEPDSWILSVSKTGFVTKTGSAINVGPGQTSTGNNFELVKNIAQISGTIISGSDPVENAAVSINASDNSGTYNTKTGINGEYVISVTAGKSYTISVVKSGYNPQSKTTGVLGSETKQTLNFSLIPSLANISGAVSDNSGVLQDVKVLVQNGGSTVSETATEYNGSYSVGLAPGTYTLVYSKSGYKSKSVNLTLAAGENITGYNVLMEKNVGSIHGIVINMLNEPVSGMIIDITGEAGNFTQTTGSDGSYFASNIPVGSYNLSFAKSGYKTENRSGVSISAGSSVKIDENVEKFRSIISGVLSDENGNTIEGANVTAGLNGKVFSTVSGTGGQYSIGSLQSGTYTISAVKTGYSSQAVQQVQVATNNVSVQFNFNGLKKNSSSIAGNITSSGNPVSDADIKIEGSKGSAALKSSQSGEYLSPLLESGSYTITISKEGYTTFTGSVEISGAVTKDFSLVKNTGIISGTVSDQRGVRQAGININLVSGGTSRSTSSSDAGEFTFTELMNDAVFKVYTDVFKEGFVNDTVSVTISGGGSSTANLTVKINNSRIYGNTDLTSVPVRLQDLVTGETRMISSSSEGNYSFGYLADGSYSITPSKEGVIFTPASRTINLSAADTVKANFTAASTLGGLKVTVSDAVANLIEQASVSLISQDETRIYNKNTGADGQALFEEIPAGTYSLVADKEGFKTGTKQVTIQSGGTVSTSITLAKNSSGVAGKITGSGGTALENANVELKYINSSSLYTASTSENGTYSITDIPAGDAKIFVTKSGYFSDSLSIKLSNNSVLSNTNIELKPNSVKLTGNVVYKGAGLSGVEIKAASSNEYFSVTNSNGTFTFDNLELYGDTTIYIVQPVLFSTDPKTLKFAKEDAGTTLNAGNFIISSASIAVSFDDRVDPVQGVKVSISNGSGFQFTSVSDNEGEVRTPENLSRGDYNFAVEKDGYLLPSDITNVISVEDNENEFSQRVLLPYTFIPADTFFADRSNLFEVQFVQNPANAAARLYYKQNSEAEYTEAAMVKSASMFRLELPPLYQLEDVSCFVEVTDASAGIVYKSAEMEYTPVAVDEISQMKLTPDFENGFLRPGDTYLLTVSLRNGEGNEILAKSAGSLVPQLKFENMSPNVVTVTVPDTAVKNTIQVETRNEGEAELKINAIYGSSSLTKTIKLTINEIEISELKLQSEVGRVSNKADGVRFSVSGADTSGQNIYLGSGLEWSVEPPEAGSIDNTGLFKPVDDTYIGQVEVTASDPLSELNTSKTINVFAEIEPDNDYITLSDKQGMSFVLRPASVNSPVEIYLSKPYAGKAKKQHTDFSTGTTYTVSDQIYNLQYYSGTALPGDTLLRAATIELPEDVSLKFNAGSKMIALYDKEEKQWDCLGKTTSVTDGYRVNEVFRFGEYAVAAANEPLGFKHIAVLPTPFSPETGPAKIGYFLNTTDRQAAVTIKIYNIEGILVKTILDNDPQVSGRYGGRMGLKEIEWDGLTDAGKIARNGRYIIRLTAKDSSGEKSELVQVVLIK